MKKMLITIIAIIYSTVFCWSQTETEPNDYFFQANTCTLNTPITLALSKAGDVDIFKVQINKGAVLEVNLNNIPTVGFYGLPVEFYVYAADSTTLLYHYFHALNPYYPNAVTSPIVLPSGLYYIKIKCDNTYSASTAGFQLVANADVTDACEINNSFATACAMPLNTVFPEKIYGYNLNYSSATNIDGLDIDYFKISVPKAGVLSVNINNIPSIALSYLKLEFFVYDFYDTTKLIAHYYHALNPYYPNAINYPIILKQGDYYIKIKADDNASTSAIAFNTSFNLDTTELCEYNNQFATACEAPLNSFITERIYGYNLLDTANGNMNGLDVDFYKIILPKDTVLTVNINQIPNDGFYGLKLEFFVYKADATTVVAHYYHPLNPYYPTDISFPVALKAGTYYVKVKADDNYSQSATAFKTSFIVSMPVPLNLIFFNANFNNQAVNLFWQTVNESNTDHFTVQQSIDNILFTNIGLLPAAGNSSFKKEYTFIDKKPNAGINYYRLQMVDKDGYFTYSKTLTVRSAAKEILLIYPTVVTDILQVQFKSEINEPIVLKILDVQGRIIAQQNTMASMGINTYAVNTNKLSKGNYFILLKAQNLYTKIFVKE